MAEDTSTTGAGGESQPKPGDTLAGAPLPPVVDASAGKTLEFRKDISAALKQADGLPQIAGYRIEELIGRGGMGHVYRARQERLERTVAVKIIRPDQFANTQAIERFQQEVLLAARLQHPHIVSVFDAGKSDHTQYLVMEYVSGQSLDRVVAAQGPLPVAVACTYIQQAARGLAHAHAQGLVHRDIKPANLMVAADPVGPVKILDFGLAKLRDSRSGTTSMTETGVIMGTPDYMAPEQFRNARDVDGRCDLYSLGATLFFALVGRPPFTGAMAEVAAGHLERRPPRLDQLRPDLPRQLADLVDRLLAKNPADRPANGLLVAEAIDPFTRPPVRRRPWLPWAGLVVAVLVLILLAGVFRPWERPAADPVPKPTAPTPQPKATIARPPAGPAAFAPPEGAETAFEENFDRRIIGVIEQNTPQLKKLFQDGTLLIELPMGTTYTTLTDGYGPVLWDFVCDADFVIEGGGFEITFREKRSEVFSTKAILRVHSGGKCSLVRQFWKHQGTEASLTEELDLLTPTDKTNPVAEPIQAVRLHARGVTIEVSVNGRPYRTGRDDYQPTPDLAGAVHGLFAGIYREPADRSARLSLDRIRIRRWK